MHNAILYRRVSEAERGEGYSLAGQRDSLRAYAAQNGLSVPEGHELEDDGWSGADLDRPGLDELRNLIAAGGVDVVVVLKRDRLARGWKVRHLEEEFKAHGARLVALNIQAEDTAEGRLQAHILDDFAAYERELIADRMRRGRLQKAREGHLIAFRVPHLGFTFDAARNGYEVLPEQMAVVERMMRLVAEGCSLHEVKRRFEAEGVRTAKGGTRWDQKVIKDALTNDIYRAHNRDELEALVQRGHLSRDVLDRLDPEARYGVHWYGTRKVETFKDRENGAIRKRTRYSARPESEHIAIPIVDPGIDPALVDAAREAVKDNVRPSRANDRTWELSGGVMFCAGCGRRMGNSTRSHYKVSGERVLQFYYRCPRGARADGCDNNRNLRADHTDTLVWDAITEITKDPHQLVASLDRLVEQEKSRLRGDPAAEELRLRQRLDDLRKQRQRAQDAALDDLLAGGLLDRSALERRIGNLDEQAAELERELAALGGRFEHIRRLEDLRDSYRRYAAITDDFEAGTPPLQLAFMPPIWAASPQYKRHEREMA